MTNKKKIVLSIITLVFVAIAGIFGFVIANKQDLNVKADTLSTNYVFYGSGIFTPVTPKTNSTSGSGFTNTAYSAYFIPSKIEKTSNGNGLIDFSYIFSSVNGVNPPSNFNSSYSSSFQFALGSWSNCIYNLSSASRWLEFAIFCSSDFNFNVISVGIRYDSSFAGNSSLYCTIIKFTAEVGYIDLLIPYYNVNNSSYAYLNRTYYLGSSFSDNQYYQFGLQEGLNRQQSDIYDSGYQKAIDENKSNWEQIGYNRGIQDASNYSFLGLIGAAFDVPLNAFKSCFDFNVLGVNMKDFFFAILSFTLILFVVRLILGGK